MEYSCYTSDRQVGQTEPASLPGSQVIRHSMRLVHTDNAAPSARLVAPSPRYQKQAARREEHNLLRHRLPPSDKRPQHRVVGGLPLVKARRVL